MNYCPNCGFKLPQPWNQHLYPWYPTTIPTWCVDPNNYVVTTDNTGVENGTKTSTKD